MALLAFLGGPLGAAALFFLASIGVVQVPTAIAPSAVGWVILVAPVLEEFAFRGALQDLAGVMLRRLGVMDVGPVTRANLLTSTVFAICHLPYHSVSLSIAVLVPSLLLGRVREVSNSVLPCVLVHAWFNACFMALLV